MGEETASKPKKEKQRKTKQAEQGDKPKTNGTAISAFSVLADGVEIDPTLSSLFAAKQPALPRPQPDLLPNDDEELSELEQNDEDDESDDVDGDTVDSSESQPLFAELGQQTRSGQETRKRKRNREDATDDLEEAHLRRLAREEDRELRALDLQRAAAKQDPEIARQSLQDSGIASGKQGSGQQDAESEDEDEASVSATPPPQHETLQAADTELAKANRTVFLGNVSTTAITSKSERKALLKHLASFFPTLQPSKEGEPEYKVESVRFRSTAYASTIPKKASYAKQELMDATTKSTNAYAVYSSQLLAREAAKHLNGTVVLGRHLRVDQIAHPAKADHRRCVFVGNLGFVDDETNIQIANDFDNREKRKPGKVPADVEEGLWQTFGKCGVVESVRVVRDSATRVGKGIAYVQFEDENAVEAALLLDGKKFPPMLPRKLRVSRAKAQKRNAKPGSNRPGEGRPSAKDGRLVTNGADASALGRATKLLGKAATAGLKNSRKHSAALGDKKTGAKGVSSEGLVFEGHRATARSGTRGLKLGGKKSKKGKPTNRSARRAAAYKAAAKQKK